MEKKSGFNTSTRLLYGTALTQKLYYSPNFVLLYSYTVDSVGGGIASNIVDFQFYPLSFRYEF